MNASNQVSLPHPSKYFNTLAALVFLAIAPLLSAEENVATPALKMHVTFENAGSDVTEEGEKIIARCAAKFEEITHRKLGEWSINICFEQQIRARGANLTSADHLRGVTTHGSASSTIRIATGQRSSWGRILAHEVTHAFVRNAYGTAVNTTLNEGLAEYMAEQFYASEVHRDLHNAQWGHFSEKLLPYVEGHRFCSEHVEDHEFPEFFAKEIKKGTSSYNCLAYEWKMIASSSN